MVIPVLFWAVVLGVIGVLGGLLLYVSAVFYLIGGFIASVEFALTGDFIIRQTFDLHDLHEMKRERDKHPTSSTPPQ